MTREAWIIDAVRTPRGIGKQGKGALSHLHPQRLGATVLGALQQRNEHPHGRGRRRDLGLQRADREAGDVHRADVGARRRLEHPGERRHARPLLRLGHHGREPRGGEHPLRHGGSRGRRWRRDDVVHGDLAAGHARRGQSPPPRAAPATAPGCVRRRDRDPRRHDPRRRRPAGAREPAARRAGDRRTAISRRASSRC